jgi:two-component system response regulator CpxR
MESMLIIDDDIHFCSMLRDYLLPYDMQLSMEHDGPAGIEAARGNQFNIVLLDIMLPGMDGFEVLAQLRAFSSSLKVLMLSALGDDVDRILGLDHGADDYLPKPFNPRELVARIRAILRRDARHPNTGQANVSMRSCGFGLAIDATRHEAFYKEAKLPLTDVEFHLLRVFLESPEVVLSREELVARIFQRPFNPLDRSLDMHICRLRRKLHIVKELPSPIKTIRSSGYLFSIPNPIAFHSTSSDPNIH